jgi:ribose 5-phosphate isomerase B
MPIESLPVIIGCDHAAIELKNQIKAYLAELDIQVEDVGTHDASSVDYPDFGQAVASRVAAGEFARGILLCGTGIGMSICANRYANVRAALCSDLFSCQMSRKHNNANVLVIGARVIGEALALAMVQTWLETPFEGGRHQERLTKIETCADI